MRILTLILVFLWSLSSVAQHPLVVNYSKKDGLPSIETYDVMQDHEGFIWISTDFGAVKFDGTEFKVFNTSNGLRSNCVFQVTEDYKGRKWLRLFNNELCYIYNDKVYYLPCSSEFSELTGVSTMKKIVVDSADNLYISMRGHNSYFKIPPPYKDLKNTTRTFDMTVGYAFIEPIGSNFLYGSNASPVWEGAVEKLKVRLKDKIFNVPSKETRSPHVYCTRVNDGSYLLSAGKSLYKVTDKGIEKLKEFDSIIISLNLFKEDQLWIGLMKGGVKSFNYPGLTNEHTLLQEYSVTGTAYDSEENLWVSTLEQGVFVIPPVGISFLNKSNGLSDEHILTSYSDGEKLYLALNDGNIAEVEKDQVIRTFRNPHFPDRPNFALIKNEKGFFAGGSFGGGYLENKDFKEPLYTPMIKAVSHSQFGDIWVGGFSDVVLFKGKERIVSKYLNTRISRIFEDKSGGLWIGTISGLFYLKNGKLTRADVQKDFNGKYSAIEQTNDGTVWVGTQGIGLYAVRNGVAEPFTTDKANSFVKALFLEPDGNSLWVATESGIFLIDAKNRTKRKLLILKDYAFEINALTVIGSRIYLSTTKGLFMVEKERVERNNKIPSVYLSSIQTSTNSINPNSSIELPYGEPRIKFNFKPISFLNTIPVSYKYKLDGGDAMWYSTESNTVEFAALKPGKYRFSVVAIDEIGQNSSKPASFSFSVATPFYLKRSFVFAEALLLIALLTFAVKRIIDSSRRKEKLKNENEKKLVDLELKALRSQMNPHFIFNSLNAVQGLILRNEQDAALTFMGKFSKLVRGVLENSEKNLISLHEEINALQLYLELEQLKYDHIFNFAIILSPDLDPRKIFLPSMLVQPLVENAIQHGVIRSERKGAIKVTFATEDPNTILVSVEDNGVGFINKPKKNEDRISLGMKVTKERLDLLERKTKSVKAGSAVLSVNSLVAGGTAVYLKIPMYGNPADISIDSR